MCGFGTNASSHEKQFIVRGTAAKLARHNGSGLRPLKVNRAVTAAEDLKA